MTLVAGAICYIIHLYFTLLSVFWVLILLGESSKQNYIFYVKLFLYAVYSEQMEGLKFLRHIYCIKYYTNQTKLSEYKEKVETIEKQQKIKASRKNSFPKIIFDNCTMQTIISPFSFVTVLIGSMWLIFFCELLPLFSTLFRKYILQNVFHLWPRGRHISPKKRVKFQTKEANYLFWNHEAVNSSSKLLWSEGKFK